jgi:hypothetical protein
MGGARSKDGIGEKCIQCNRKTEGTTLRDLDVDGRVI